MEEGEEFEFINDYSFFYPTTNELVKINQLTIERINRVGNENIVIIYNEIKRRFFSLPFDKGIDEIINRLGLKFDTLCTEKRINIRNNGRKLSLRSVNTDNIFQPATGDSYSLSFFLIMILSLIEEFGKQKIRLPFKSFVITGSIGHYNNWRQVSTVNDIEEKYKNIIQNLDIIAPVENKVLFIYVAVNGEALEFEDTPNSKIELLRVEDQDNGIMQILEKMQILDTLKTLEQNPNNENLPATNAKPVPTKSYIKGVRAFDENDAEIFANLGRENEKEEIYNAIIREDFRFGVLSGVSGVGKTSFLKASLIPFSIIMHSKFECIYLKITNESPLLTLRKKYNLGREAMPDPIQDFEYIISEITQNKPLTTNWLIVLDQFEQFYLTNTPEERQNFSIVLNFWKNNLKDYARIKFLISIREDLYGKIFNELMTTLDIGLFPNKNSFVLKKFTPDQAVEILIAIATNAELEYEEVSLKEFVEKHLISKEDNEHSISPVDLQVFITVAKRQNKSLSSKDFLIGGLEELYRIWLNSIFERRKENKYIDLAFRILLYLFEENHRVSKTMEQIKKEFSNLKEKMLIDAIVYLSEMRLITENTEEQTYELAHEKLIQPIRKMSGQILGKEEKIRELLLGRVGAWTRNKEEKKYLLDLVDYFKIWKGYRPFFSVAGNKELIERYIKESKKRFMGLFKMFFLYPTSIILISYLVWLGHHTIIISETGFEFLFEKKRDAMISEIFPTELTDFFDESPFALAHLAYLETMRGNEEYIKKAVSETLVNSLGIKPRFYKNQINTSICFAKSEIASTHIDENAKIFLKEALEISEEITNESLPDNTIGDMKDKCFLFINYSLLKLYYKTDNEKMQTNYLNDTLKNLPKELSENRPNRFRILALLNFVTFIHLKEKNKEIDNLNEAFALIDKELDKYKQMEEKFDQLQNILQILYYLGLSGDDKFDGYFEKIKKIYSSNLIKTKLVYPKFKGKIEYENWYSYREELNRYKKNSIPILNCFKKYVKFLHFMKMNENALEVIRELTKLSINSKLPDGLLIASELYLIMKNYEEADSAFDQALNIHQKNAAETSDLFEKLSKLPKEDLNLKRLKSEESKMSSNQVTILFLSSLVFDHPTFWNSKKTSEIFPIELISKKEVTMYDLINLRKEVLGLKNKKEKNAIKQHELLKLSTLFLPPSPSFSEKLEILELYNLETFRYYDNYKGLPDTLHINKIYFEDRVYKKIKNSNLSKEEYSNLLTDLAAYKPFNPFYQKLSLDVVLWKLQVQTVKGDDINKEYIKTWMYYYLWLYTNNDYTMQENNPQDIANYSFDIPYDYNNYFNDTGYSAKDKLEAELYKFGLLFFR